MADDGLAFRYPSYVQDIMGDIFSLGFGPFRCTLSLCPARIISTDDETLWSAGVCTSGEAEDLATTDRIATEIVAGLRDSSPEKSKQQYEDNYLWITQAADHKLVRANPTALA